MSVLCTVTSTVLAGYTKKKNFIQQTARVKTRNLCK